MIAFFHSILLGIVFLLSRYSAVEANCVVHLDTSTDPCVTECMGSHANAENTFVCDRTVPWLHHVGGSDDWWDATPPAGTGVHEYALFQGTAPCDGTLGSCYDCHNPAGAYQCSVHIDPSDCSITC